MMAQVAMTLSLVAALVWFRKYEVRAGVDAFGERADQKESNNHNSQYAGQEVRQWMY